MRIQSEFTITRVSIHPKIIHSRCKFVEVKWEIILMQVKLITYIYHGRLLQIVPQIRHALYGKVKERAHGIQLLPSTKFL